MSFQLVDEGSREAVIKHLEAFKELDADGKTPVADQTQANTARLAAIAEIKALPAEFNGCRIHIEGSAHGGGRALNVHVIPRKFRL